MFIRGKILIFEGPDGVGKTTLINYFKKKVQKPFYMHLRVHKNMLLWHTASARLAIRKQMEGKTVLIDRHWPSEQFYSYIRSKGPSYNPRYLYNKLKERGAKYIWCIPEDKTQVKENHRINRTKREEEYWDIDQVIDGYYHAWYTRLESKNFICSLSPLKERADFIRYDYYKDGHKMDAFTDKVLKL
jgi:GTPase SAR1 family protein